MSLWLENPGGDHKPMVFLLVEAPFVGSKFPQVSKSTCAFCPGVTVQTWFDSGGDPILQRKQSMLHGVRRILDMAWSALPTSAHDESLGLSPISRPPTVNAGQCEQAHDRILYS